MERQLARLAVVQVGLIVYAILAAAIFAKIHAAQLYAIETPAVRFARNLRDYGLWLLFVPAIWSGVCFWLQRRPEGDHSTFAGLYFTGLGIAILLLFLALKTTMVVRAL